MTIKKLDPELYLSGEAVFFLSSALDFLSGGQFSGAMKALKALHKAVSFRDKIHIKKLIAVFNELNEKLEDTDPALLAQTLKNLKDEYGKATFEESFYSAIERSETVERARMVARLLANSTTDSIISKNYASILNVINNLGLDDFKYLADAKNSSLIVNGNTQRNRPLHIQGTQTKFTVDGYMKYFTPARLRRFNAVGLCKQAMLIEDDTIYYVDENFAELVLKAIS